MNDLDWKKAYLETSFELSQTQLRLLEAQASLIKMKQETINKELHMLNESANAEE